MGNSESTPKKVESERERGQIKFDQKQLEKEQRRPDEGKQKNLLQLINSQLLTPLKPNFKAMYGWPFFFFSISMLFSCTYFRRLRSLRYMIDTKKYPTPFWKLTSYDISFYNKMEFSEFIKLLDGEPGIGTTKSILDWINQASHHQPIFYIPLKTTQGTTSIDQQIKKHIKLQPIFSKGSFLRNNEWCDHTAFFMLKSQLNKMKFMRQHYIFSFSALLSPLVLLGTLVNISTIANLSTSSLIAAYGTGMFFGGCYLWLAYPFLKYCIIRSIPIVVFDDINMMVLHKNTWEVQKCGQLYRMMLNNQANVFLSSSDPRTYSVLTFMPGYRDIIIHNQLKFYPKEIYNVVLEDKKANFKNFKEYFLRDLLNNEKQESILPNEVIQYLVQKIKQRELPLRQLKNIFQFRQDRKYSNQIYLNEFIYQFKTHIQSKNFSSRQQKENKLKKIVKEFFESITLYYLTLDYDEQQRIDISIKIKKLKTLNWLSQNQLPIRQYKVILEQLILDLGNKAGNTENKPFRKNIDFNQFQFLQEFIKINLLKTDKDLWKFESKMKKMAFKAWFEKERLQVEQNKIDRDRAAPGKERKLIENEPVLQIKNEKLII